MADISRVTERLWTGGPCRWREDAFDADLALWRAAGITHVIDNRLERNDGERILAVAPRSPFSRTACAMPGTRCPTSGSIGASPSPWKLSAETGPPFSPTAMWA